MRSHWPLNSENRLGRMWVHMKITTDFTGLEKYAKWNADYLYMNIYLYLFINEI